MFGVAQFTLPVHFLSATMPTTLIFDKNWNALGTIPYLEDDPNHGLPNWFFGMSEDKESEYGDILYGNVVNLGDGRLEWVPAVGPNPVWEVKAADFDNVVEMLHALRDWIKENY